MYIYRCACTCTHYIYSVQHTYTCMVYICMHIFYVCTQHSTALNSCRNTFFMYMYTVHLHPPSSVNNLLWRMYTTRTYMYICSQIEEGRENVYHTYIHVHMQSYVLYLGEVIWSTKQRAHVNEHVQCTHYVFACRLMYTDKRKPH